MTELTSEDFQLFVDKMKQRGKRVYAVNGEITISPTQGLGVRDIFQLSDISKSGDFAKWLSEPEGKEC